MQKMKKLRKTIKWLKEAWQRLNQTYADRKIIGLLEDDSGKKIKKKNWRKDEKIKARKP